jgi:hypothetical protein
MALTLDQVNEYVKKKELFEPSMFILFFPLGIWSKSFLAHIHPSIHLIPFEPLFSPTPHFPPLHFPSLHYLPEYPGPHIQSHLISCGDFLIHHRALNHVVTAMMMAKSMPERLMQYVLLEKGIVEV